MEFPSVRGVIRRDIGGQDTALDGITLAALEVNNSIDSITAPLAVVAGTPRACVHAILSVQMDAQEVECLATEWTLRWDLRVAIARRGGDVVLIHFDAVALHEPITDRCAEIVEKCMAYVFVNGELNAVDGDRQPVRYRLSCIVHSTHL